MSTIRDSKELVKHWVSVHHSGEMSSSSVVHSMHRRVKSASTHADYKQPVESLTVSFSNLLVDQINERSLLPSNGAKKKKKRPISSKSCICNNKPVTQIDHVEEWLQQRSAHYAWWRKSPIANKPRASKPTQDKPPSAQTINRSQPQHHIKSSRCILWFKFTGNPLKRSIDSNPKSIRIEQQPLGGANALVFAADLTVGEEFAVLSRRQPGFTFSLTFYIDGVRHARLSGCCENARNLHVPTRVGGPIGAFVLRSVQGGEPCQVCEKSAPVADPQLFTVWPKGFYRHLNISQDSDETHQEPSRRRSSTKRAQKIVDVAESPVENTSNPLPVNEETPNEETNAVSIPSEELTEEQPSADTFVPESIEEVYDDLDEARFTGQSVSIEEVIHLLSPHSHSPLVMDS